MVLKNWEKILNESDYKVWKKKGTSKKIAVFKNMFSSPFGRNYNKKTHKKALSYAKEYMKNN